jgi:hypothetical protein
MRWKMYKIALQLDKGVYTPSDFCVMGMEMEFDDYSMEHMEEKVKEVFDRKYQAKVEYVNPCFKIGDIYALNDKFNALEKMKRLIEVYCEDNDITGDDVKNFDGWQHPGAPKFPGMCCKKAVVMSELEAEI